MVQGNLAERHLIGAMMIDPAAAYPVVRQHLRRSDFDDPLLGDLFDELCRLGDAGEPLMVTSAVMRVANDQPDVASLARIVAEEISHTEAGWCEYYCKELIQRSIRRQLAELPAAADVAETNQVIREIHGKLADCQERLDNITHQIKTVREASLQELAENYLDQLEANDGQTPHVPMATAELDEAVGYSTNEGDTVIVGACPGHGKTLFIMQSLHRAAEAGRVAVLFSLEMSDQAIGERVVSMLVEDGAAPSEARRVIKDYWSSRTVIFRRCDPKLSTLMSEMQRMKQEFGASVFGIDYLGLVQGPGNSRYEQQTNTIAGIQSKSALLGITSIVGCQLSRPSDKHKAFIPTLHHLRDSGQIEASGNTIFLMRDPMKDIKSPPDTNLERPEELIEVRVAKLRNRDLPTGVILLRRQSSPLALVDPRTAHYEPAFDDWNNS